MRSTNAAHKCINLCLNQNQMYSQLLKPWMLRYEALIDLPEGIV